MRLSAQIQWNCAVGPVENELSTTEPHSVLPSVKTEVGTVYCPGVFPFLKSQEPVMRTGDLGSSPAFTLPLTRGSSQSHSYRGGEGLDSVLSWSLSSHFKHVTFKIPTQLLRTDRVTIATYLSRCDPQPWPSGWCSFCLGAQKKGHE